MKSIAFFAAALISAGAASALEVSPGKTQIAAPLGLDAASYSLSELSVIAKARQEGDVAIEKFYLAGSNRESRGGIGEVSSGKAQFAAQLGLDPAQYTLSELVEIAVAKRDGRVARAAYVISHENREVRGAAGEVSPGKAQLAANLGVEAANLSLADLVVIDVELNGDN